MFDEQSADILSRGFAAGGWAIFVAFLIVGAYLMIKAVNLVVRVLVRYPTSRPLRAALWCFLAISVIMALSRGQYPAINSAAVASFAALLITARAVGIYFDQMLQRELEPEFFLSDVLHPGGWWQTA